MTRVTLSFDVPDDQLHKLIPSVSIYAIIYTSEGIVEVLHDPPGKGIAAKTCTNARLRAE